eukprot:TRINITY_DN16373_c0_g1_i1.p2 TRINITY_DN16373_c0_g1~~TRINITY_DN16373_c0_g1_i1.p2  ORF type:complete len:176 (+),score=27.96 TRINITY_DN16373_c0_g1_i1:53-580(+)
MAMLVSTRMLLAAFLTLGTWTPASSVAMKGIFPMYDAVITASKCGCHCCIVERRRPDEDGGQHAAQCTTPPESSATCPGTQCSVVDDPVFTTVTTVDMERYCFLRCRPEGSMQPSEKVAMAEDSRDASFHGGLTLNTACVPVPHSLEGFSIEPDGNGRDHMLPESIPEYETLQAR